MNLIHGGDITSYRLRYGRDPLDFSASLNPLGMPPEVAKAAREAVAASTPYPDPLSRRLGAALGAHIGVDAERLFIGNGAADILFRLALALRPRKALVPVPTFGEYALALETAGSGIRTHILEEDKGFTLQPSFIQAITSDIDMIFLCQPNNPTGLLMERNFLEDIVRAAASHNAVVVVDECFCDFTAAPGDNSLIDRIGQHHNLVLLYSFTKMFAMAGLRLGYAVAGDASLPARLQAAGQPWPVSAVATAAGLAALNQTEYVKNSREIIFSEKKWLCERLAAAGMRIIGAEANYIFFYSSLPDLAGKMADKGILIRDCANFAGLRQGFYRIAVRQRAENRLLLQAVNAIATEANAHK